VPDGVDPKAMLGVYGVNGLTAYFGMTEIGKVQPGDTVFVSGAAGSVGSIAGQIARLKGARVIGSAGGQEKCTWTTTMAGFEACIDYNNGNIHERLKDLAPTGIDVVFDNVGGMILEAALDNLALHARIVICGSISSGYRENAYGHSPQNYMQLAFRRARMEGFIFLDYVEKIPSAFMDLHGWVSSRSIVFREDIVVGLERAPLALQGLFEGRNRGKQLVQVSVDT
jgi:NADPH-dependent curcumin reductase CurA